MTSDGRRLSSARLATIAGALVVVPGLLIGGRLLLEEKDVAQGAALDNTDGGAIVQPLPPDTPLSLGIVTITNQSRNPIELVSARLLRLDPDLQLLGFSVLPTGPNAYGMNPPITWLEWPLRGAVPLRDYPPIPPAPDDHEQAVVMFGLAVKPEGAGKAVGIEVTYRQNGKLRKQVFEDQVYVCWVPTKDDGDCPGVDESRYSNVFGDFEDEVKVRKKRS
ncbi:MAG: hypothetical protein AB1679_28790 [Actinomycetota bacterium]|jgi:hypothetical protein